MAKSCPKCGKSLPDDAKFCMDCGYTIQKDNVNGSIFSNGKIFIVIIAVVLVIGLAVIAMSGNGNSDDNANANDVEHLDFTIVGVGGWDGGTSKKSYTLYTSALFNEVPEDSKQCTIKTTYYDGNGSEIGHEIEKFDDVYYDTEYAIGFGYYTTYKLPNPDHVTVEIIKKGNVIDNFTEKIDKNQIEYLN